MAANHTHKFVHDLNSNLINAVVIISIFREITLHLVVSDNILCYTNSLQLRFCCLRILYLLGDLNIISHYLNLCVLNCGERVCHNRQASDSCCKVSLNLSVMKSHLYLLIAVLVMHIVNHVECIYIYLCKPLHHSGILFHNIVIIQIIALDSSVFRSYLNTSHLVYTTIDSIEKTFCKVRSCTKELHLLAHSHGGYTTCDCIIITMCHSHQVIILILNRRSLNRNLCTELLKVCR